MDLAKCHLPTRAPPGCLARHSALHSNGLTRNPSTPSAATRSRAPQLPGHRECKSHLRAHHDEQRGHSPLEGAAVNGVLPPSNPTDVQEESLGNDPHDNPDLDDLQLDDKYYAEMGLDEDEVEEASARSATDIDPEGKDIGLDDVFELREGMPQYLMDEVDGHGKEAWGPEAVVMAGFRAEELAMARVVLDGAGGHAVRLVPCMGNMLYSPVRSAVHAPEPDWESPRPGDWTPGGGWGSQRTILFSGLSLQAQATVIELLESSGLPPICAATADEDNADLQVGQVLAEAVKTQRGRLVPSTESWEDRLAEELQPVEDVLREQTQARIKELTRDLEDGKLEGVFGADGDGGPDEVSISMEDIQAAQRMKLEQRAARQQQRPQQQQQQQGAEVLSPASKSSAAAAAGGAGGRYSSGSRGDEGLVVEAQFQNSAVAPTPPSPAAGPPAAADRATDGSSAEGGSPPSSSSSPPSSSSSSSPPSSSSSSSPPSPSSSWAPASSAASVRAAPPPPPGVEERVESVLDSIILGKEMSLEGLLHRLGDASGAAREFAAAVEGASADTSSWAAAPLDANAGRQEGVPGSGSSSTTTTNGSSAAFGPPLPPSTAEKPPLPQQPTSQQQQQGQRDGQRAGTPAGGSGGSNIIGGSSIRGTVPYGPPLPPKQQQQRKGAAGSSSASSSGGSGGSMSKQMDTSPVGQRSTSTSSWPRPAAAAGDTDPLQAVRSAVVAAMDAGIDAEVLRRIVDEAERGGSPVVRGHIPLPQLDEDLPPNAVQGAAGPPPSSPATGPVITRAQLQDVAQRRGLSLERLLADARAKGVVIPDE